MDKFTRAIFCGVSFMYRLLDSSYFMKIKPVVINGKMKYLCYGWAWGKYVNFVGFERWHALEKALKSASRHSS